jgi:ubiquinone/menaquinone biosynthesis C-methylase UbiE
MINRRNSTTSKRSISDSNTYVFHGGILKDAVKKVLDDFLKGLDEDAYVLDAATGSGETTVEIAHRIKGRVVSVDIDPLQSAQERIRNSKFSSRIEFIEGNLANMEFLEDYSIDAIVSHATVSSIPSETPFVLSRVLEEFYRVLTPNGAMIIIDYYPLDESNIETEADRIAQEAWRVYKAVAELVGDSHHEEIQPQRIIEMLEGIGFIDCTVKKISERMLSTTFDEYVESMLAYVKDIGDHELQNAFHRKIMQLHEQAKIHGKSDYSDTYCIWAKK